MQGFGNWWAWWGFCLEGLLPSFLHSLPWAHGEGELVEGVACLGLLVLFLPCRLHFLNLAFLLGWLHSWGCLGEHNLPLMNFSGLLFQ